MVGKKPTRPDIAIARGLDELYGGIQNGVYQRDSKKILHLLS